MQLEKNAGTCLENILDLCFKHQLSPGNYTLSISYVTYIDEGIGEGYFKILFQPEARKQYRLLATNIQSIEARKWFPCWNEPEFKATFLIRFNHEMKYKIWPIWPTTRFTPDDHKQGWVWTTFVIPYPISTYHVMFTLTDLDLAYISTHEYTYNSEYYDEYEDEYAAEYEYEDKNISHPTATESSKIRVFSTWSRRSVANSPVILRMLQHITGYKFLKIIKNYRDTYKFQSPSLNDLWDLMQNTMDNPKLKNYTLKNIMETWITRNNHPVVHVHRSENLLSISEHYIDDEGVVHSPTSRNWLPITFTTWKQLDFNNTVPYNWILPEKSSEVHVPLSDSDGWIIVNLKQTGYYRVRYDYTSLKAIADYLKHKEYEKIHVINRAQIIDDTYYFFMKGEVTYDMFAYLIYYLRQERDYVAWYPMFQIFRDLSRFLPFEESEPLTKDMRFILQGLLENLTYNEKVDEDDLTKWLRREVVKWACIFGDTDCEEIAHSRLEKHLNDPTNHKLLPKWREWTYCKGAMIADENVLLKLEKLLRRNDHKVFDYISCAEKPRFAIASFYYSPSWEDKYPIIFRYAIFGDYTVQHVAAIIGILEAYK
ncbi:aminopeptidase N [Ooceraea biroi]|uniref:aminopeptidase N n=1 Tax=Ooceraea biroi TaxID=2015173 RepID=UPI000F087709|nr:aminopeptidase N [Ooceraea biroi]